ncbi:hypothetical protein PG994_007092 [Apiospora phragmitis]|uniref:Uncharacterized protein n=1 Tax=Apiospora phragmitis TaxID=2905665 RepID=A0ABR1UZU3_9PEZI
MSNTMSKRTSRLWGLPCSFPQLPPNNSTNIGTTTIVSTTNPSKKRNNTPNIGIITTTKRLSNNWRKAIDAVRRTLVLRSSTTARTRSGGTCTNLTPQASQAARFTRSLNDAVFSPFSPQHGWPGRHNRGGSRYRAVKVLLTYWAETDDPAFGAAGAACALADVFRRRYGFEVLVWLIPVLQPQQALAAKLRQFAREEDDIRQQQSGESLLIFWYGGSAREDDTGSGGPVLWFGETFGGQTINSQIVPQILGAAKADVLTLYDTPHALHGYNVTGSGLCEHLGASAHDGAVAGFVANSNYSLSFTRALIRILDNPDRAAHGIAVLDLHRKLVNRYQTAITAASAAAAAGARSGSESSDEGKQGSSSDDNDRNKGKGKINKKDYAMRTLPWLPNALRQTPVYCHLSRCRPRSEGGPASIVLAQLGYRHPPPQETSSAARPNENTTATPHGQGPGGVDDDKKENDEEGAVEVTMRMRMRVRPLADAADIRRWKNWILDAPPEASQLVHLQAKPT